MAAAGHDVALEPWSAQYPKLLYRDRLTVDEPELPLFHRTRRRLSWPPGRVLRAGQRIGRWADRCVAVSLDRAGDSVSRDAARACGAPPPHE